MNSVKSIEEKLSQMFMVSFHGAEVNDESYKHFQESSFSNFVFFSRNLTTWDRVESLCKDLYKIARENSNIPPFLSIDQEGGMVARLFSGATHFPSAMALGVSGIDRVAYTMGCMVGKELRNLGINFNLAPVLDVNNNPNNPVIGVRSFSEDPRVVAEMGVDYIKGLQESGVIATGKHFPGHGNTNVDSHIGLPVIERSIAELREVELIPFARAIEQGVMAIMSAHIIFPSLDPSRTPGTLSKPILTDLLRKEMGYKGLIISDALDMGAIAERYTIGEACVQAIEAGVDLLCLSGSGNYEMQSEGYRYTLEAVQQGRLDESLIHRSYSRIVEAKGQIGLCFDYEEEPKSHYESHEMLANEISKKSITIQRDDLNLLPLGDKRIFVISTPPIRANIADDSIVQIRSFAYIANEQRGWDYKEIDVDPSNEDIEGILVEARKYEVVILATYNGILHKNQIALANRLRAIKDEVVFVTLRVPYDIQQIEGAGTYIHAYEYTNRSIVRVLDLIDPK